jgi:membrane-bound lytic murein transglycosylase B
MKNIYISLRSMLFLLYLACLAIPAAQADYGAREDVRRFVDEIATRNQLDPAPILAVLARAKFNPRVIELIEPSGQPAERSWQRYRAQFLDPAHIDGGLRFWKQYAKPLQRAAAQYHVPPEIIVAIIGIETAYGRNTGKFETLSALATLAFDYPPRATLFRGELESLFLLARDQGKDPSAYTGSYAGALGYPQFLPSSMRRYAVDFDDDGKIDFDADANDAIGSIANYLHEHGWQANGIIALPAVLPRDADPAPLVAAGILPSLTPEQLGKSGIALRDGSLPAVPATLVDLETPGQETEYWIGYQNFYVITRYNKSSFYAMAVFELARALRQGRDAVTSPASDAPARTGTPPPPRPR